MEKGNFCCLCGKMRNDPLTNIPLGMIDEKVMVRVDACRQCDVILHNIGRLFEDARKNWMEKQKKEMEGR